MNRNSKRIFRITAVSTGLLLLSLLTWGLQRAYFRPKPVRKQASPKDSLDSKISYDPVIFAGYERLYQKYDTIKTNCTMSGIINITDKADTANNMKNVGFIFSKAAGDFYYQLGTTETINAKGLYIFIDHKGQTIVLSSQKAINYDPQPTTLADLGKNMQSDGYKMSSNVNGSIQTISLNNEHNINCKQFSVSFDTAAMEITHLYARMTNLEYPSEKDKEKIVDITLSAWNAKGDPDKYFKRQDIVYREHGKWKTAERYKNYNLTVL